MFVEMRITEWRLRIARTCDAGKARMDFLSNRWMDTKFLENRELFFCLSI